MGRSHQQGPTEAAALGPGGPARRPHPVWDTISRSTRTASSLLMFSKLTSFTWEGEGFSTVGGALTPQHLPAPPTPHTCSSMSPGSMRPSAATAPPFMMEPM